MNFGLMRELQIGHKHAGVVISYVSFFFFFLFSFSFWVCFAFAYEEFLLMGLW